jgi:PmbA protein
MISGNLAELLLNIGQISKETVNDGFTVLPYVSFPGVTISGK